VPKRQGLEAAQDLADVPELCGIQWADAEASTKRCFDHALSNKSEERFPHRGPADPQLGRERDITNSAAGGELTPLDLGEDALIDLIPERYARDHNDLCLNVMFCTLYTIYNMVMIASTSGSTNGLPVQAVAS
jgi:hypothetical protein